MPTIPKSLHTVTSVVRLARHFQLQDKHLPNGSAVRDAFLVLGYQEGAQSDDHCLFAKCVKVMESGK